MSETYYSYILASKRHGALYVDLTDDLVGAVMDHKCNLVNFTALYLIHQLVYYQRHPDEASALRHVQWINSLHRLWKIDLVETVNPDWCDLYDELRVNPVGMVNAGLVECR